MENSIIVDDIVLGCMDLSIARIVTCVDIVISSLSTLLLDAVIAGKPAIQYRTGNKFSFEFCDPVSFESISEMLKQGDFALPVDSSDFRAHYASAEDGRFYERFAELLASAPAGQSDVAAAALSYSLGSLIEDQHLALQRSHHAANELNARVGEAAAETQRLAAQALEERHMLTLRSQSEIEQIRAQQNELVGSLNAEFESQRNSLLADKDQLIFGRDRLVSENARLLADRDKLVTDRDQIEASLHQTRMRLRDASARIEAIEHSTSWRCTAPLRWASARFRKPT